MGQDITRYDNQIRVEVVTTQEQLLHAYSVRAICFMDEHGVSARQTYDGNDLQATHFIAYAGQEPIGTARIRWFRDFAKMERSCLRKEWRGPRMLQACGLFIFEHVSRKGYERLITHASPKYARMWRLALGFTEVTGKAPLHFEGHNEPYVELVKDLTPPPNAISAETDVAVLFRVEGAWDMPSEFEAAEL